MLEVQNLSYSTKTFSMENVSFSLDDGYLMTLLGRNGAGKTTLFDLVYGRIEPLSGKVLWNDIDVTGMKAIDILYHDEVAYVGGRSWCKGGRYYSFGWWKGNAERKYETSGIFIESK